VRRSLDLRSWEAASDLVRSWEASGELGVVKPEVPTNGAGQSTVASDLLQDVLAVDEFVNADVIARGLSGFEPDRAAIAAGRSMLARLKELAARRVDFAFETTLATRSFAPWLRDRCHSGLAVT
jgi:predicted ABC-type ATPase